MITLDLENLPDKGFGATSVTIGNFDGVHLGHRELIGYAVKRAIEEGLKSVLVTFEPHPAYFFDATLAPPMICSAGFKRKLIASLGVNAILPLAFEARLASLSPKRYVRDILLNKLNAKIVSIGYDFTFGAGRSGHAETMREIASREGFEAFVLPQKQAEGIVVSSTKIREFLFQGKVEGALRLLGRPHIISGRVVEGKRRGRTIGFPTINLGNREGMLPAAGVYGGAAFIRGKEYAAGISVGYNPTFSGAELTVEAHLVGFSEEAYGEEASLAFLMRIRDEKKFENVSALAARMREDIKISEERYLRHSSSENEGVIFWP